MPAGGIETEDGHKSYDEFCADLAKPPSSASCRSPKWPTPCSARSSPPTPLERIDRQQRRAGQVVLASTKLDNPDFPAAKVRTPVLLACDAADEKPLHGRALRPDRLCRQGPPTAPPPSPSPERVVSTHGALTVGVYSTRQDVIDAMTEATWRSKVALSINLTGGVFVNQSAAIPTTTAPAATRRPTPRMRIRPSSQPLRGRPSHKVVQRRISPSGCGARTGNTTNGTSSL